MGSAGLVKLKWPGFTPPRGLIFLRPTDPGGLTNAQYVDWLYQNALGRHAESAGLSYWTDQLDHGGARAGVTTAIGESVEAQQHHLADIEAGWHLL